METRQPVENKLPAYYLFSALGLQFGLVLLVILLIGPYAWDDGAITLAYSKTFAETGRIALTAASEQVEGFSSVAWFLINAFIALFNLNFEATISAAQVASGLFLGISTIFIWLIAKRINLRSETAFAIILVFSILGPSISEVANGMEMTLLTACGLALIYTLYYQPNRLILTIAAVIFLLSRFEAMIYYAALLAPLLLQRRFRSFVLLAAFGLMVVCLQEIVRHAVFRDVMPNSIYAKMHDPYISTGFNIIFSRIRSGSEALRVLLPLIGAIGGFVALTQRARKGLIDCLRAPLTIPDDFVVLLAPIVAVILFAILTGENWGYKGRMQFLGLPFILLVCGLIFDRFMNTGKLSGFKIRRATLCGASVVTILFSWYISAAEPLRTIALYMAGKGRTLVDSFDETPASYRDTGLAVDKIRQIAKLDKIVFLTPDVGGLGLCCSLVRVVDIGLLSNRQLAHDGYRAFPEVFSKENPDVIEVHLVWAQLPNIYNNSEFNEKYQPALVHGTRLYIRDDLAEKISANSRGKYCGINDRKCLVAALRTHRYLNHTNKVDDFAFLKRGRILIVDE